MPVVIVKRITKGAPLTPAEHDQNLQNLKDACDDNGLAVTGRVTTVDFAAAFSGDSGAGKKLVAWGDIINVPTSVSVPTAVISPYAGSVAPSGYLMCNGQAVSRTTYADLFTSIGTVYGVGDGSSTFNVPDTRGRSLLGSGTGDATGATLKIAGQKLANEASVLGSAAGLTGDRLPFAWVRWSNSGGLQGKYNVASVSYNGGSPIVTFTNPAPDSTYAVISNGSLTGSPGTEAQMYCHTKSTTAFTLTCSLGGGSDPVAFIDTVVYATGTAAFSTESNYPVLVTNYIIKT